jgi:hypothetical protein
LKLKRRSSPVKGLSRQMDLAFCRLVLGLVVAWFRTFLQISALASHWLEDCANFTTTPEENDKYSASQPLLVQYKQQANLLLSVHKYSPLVISRNDKISS